MKKYLLLAIISFATSIVFAQQKAPNALTKTALLKLSSTGIANDKLGKAYPAFFEYYNTKALIEKQAAAADSRISLQEELAKIIVVRDEKLKAIFSETEMSNFKTKVEAQLAAEEKK